MPICHTGEYPIRFEETGHGVPIVLIHGHALDLRVWDDMVPTLAGAGYRVIRYDVRGHGESFAPDTGYSWAAYVEDLRALLGHVGVEEVVLAGFSMGGGIALSFAQAYPGRVAALALVASALPGFSYSDEVTGPLARMTARMRERGAHPTIEQDFIATSLFDGLRSNADALNRARAMVAGYSAKEYFATGETQPDHVIERLPTMTVPTLIASGTHDMRDLQAIARLLASRVPGAKTATFAAGHMLPMEVPGDLAAALIAFASGARERA